MDFHAILVCFLVAWEVSLDFTSLKLIPETRIKFSRLHKDNLKFDQPEHTWSVDTSILPCILSSIVNQVIVMQNHFELLSQHCICVLEIQDAHDEILSFTLALGNTTQCFFLCTYIYIVITLLSSMADAGPFN